MAPSSQYLLATLLPFLPSFQFGDAASLLAVVPVLPYNAFTEVVGFPSGEIILTDSDDFHLILLSPIDLAHLRFSHPARTAADAPYIEQQVSAIQQAFKEMMLVALHVEEFGINGLFAYLENMRRINIGVNFCQLVFKPFWCSGSERLLQILQLFHVWEVFHVLQRPGYAPQVI